ncbi:MAG: tRNA pseudouridine(55) synthase TruB [Oscillospiraceae bacterium]
MNTDNYGFNGILPVNKPAGFTSFDVIAKLRGILKMKRLGHGGTLDPMATGVLPVFAGKCTRACDILPTNEKRYTAGFHLGIETDTQDSTGTVLREQPSAVTAQELTAAFATRTGEIEQLPPMFSAVSVGGKRLYEYARDGVEIERAARTVTVKAFTLLTFDEQTQCGTADILCSKRTDVRTLLHDAGQALGVGAVMTSLERTLSGGIALADCLTLAQIEVLAQSGTIANALIKPDAVFASYEALTLDARLSALYLNGVKLNLSQVLSIMPEQEALYRVYGADGVFLGLARADLTEQLLRVYRNF